MTSGSAVTPIPLPEKQPSPRRPGLLTAGRRAGTCRETGLWDAGDNVLYHNLSVVAHDVPEADFWTIIGSDRYLERQ